MSTTLPTRAHVVPSVADAASAMADAMADRLRAAVAERGRAGLAVSGGRTPRLVLPLLALADLAWDRVTVTLTDERWVAPEHPDSNEGLARRLLLTGPAAAARFLGFHTGDSTAAAGQPAVERQLAALPLPLDTVFLGMGEDGHMASLFPGGPELVTGGLCVPSRAPLPPRERLSLTVQALLSARHATLLVDGTAKRAAYEKALAQPLPEDLRQAAPIALLLHQRRMPVDVFLVAGAY